jgi:hypothetical protein
MVWWGCWSGRIFEGYLRDGFVVSEVLFVTMMAGLLLLGETVEVCVGGGELNGGERIADETDGSMVRRGGRCNISGGRGVSDNVAVFNGCFCKTL